MKNPAGPRRPRVDGPRPHARQAAHFDRRTGHEISTHGIPKRLGILVGGGLATGRGRRAGGRRIRSRSVTHELRPEPVVPL
jgi:hypothetical protein